MTQPSAIFEKRATAADRTLRATGSATPAAALGVTQNSCTRPPAQTAAASTWPASTAVVSSPRPGSPAWPDRPGMAIDHSPSAAAGSANSTTSQARRLAETA